MTDRPQPLALAHRPREFEHLAGQPHVVRILSATVANHRAGRAAPAGWLFSGPSGTGKTSTARMFAAALNAPTGYDFEPRSIVEVDAATNTGVDAIRELTHQATYRSPTLHRTFVLDECHALSDAAWKALLKALEEPTPATTWVLVTTELAKVPDAVVSRCVALPFRAVGADDVLARLVAICQAEQIGAELDALRLVARDARGGVRSAVVGLDQLRLAGPVTVATYEALHGSGVAAPAYLAALRSGDLGGAMGIANAYTASTGEPLRLLDEVVDVLAGQLSASSGSERTIVAALVALWEARSRLASDPLGPTGSVAVVTALLADALGVRPAATHGPHPSTTSSSTVDLAAVLGGGLADSQAIG